MILAKDCRFAKLNDTLTEAIGDFDCGDDDMNDFFRNDAIHYARQLLGKTYCFISKVDTEKIICAFTISNDAILAQELPSNSRNRLGRAIPWNKRKIGKCPAILIGRLGVHKDFRSQKIGSQLLELIKIWFADSENKTGCRFVTVDAYNAESVLCFYKQNNFDFIFKTESEEREHIGILAEEPLRTRSMFFDLAKVAL